MRHLFATMLAAVLSLTASVAVAADQPVIGPAPAWVAPMPSAPSAPSDPAKPLFVDRQIHLSRKGVVTYLDFASRINSVEQLAQAVNIALPWQPDKGDLFFHRIELIRGTQTIDVLKSGQKFTVLRREAQLEQLQVNGLLTATMQIEGAQVGDVVRIAFSISYADPTLAGNVNSTMPLSFGGFEIAADRIRAVWPDETPIRWKVSDARVKPRVRSDKGMTELVITGPIPRADAVPEDAPVRFRIPAMIEFSTFADWRQVSAINARLYATDADAPLDKTLAGEIEQIAAATTNPRSRAALALQLVQDKVRYLYNGMALGGYVPATASESWARRYGDCKAKTLLLLTVLRKLGIEAEPALASVAVPDSAADRLPSFQAFDHVVARARIDGKWLWLDPTGLGNRRDDLDDVPAYGAILPARPAGADLERLTPSGPARPFSTVDLDIDARAGLAFPALFKLRHAVRGQFATLLRASRDTMPAKEHQGFIRALVWETLPNAPLLSQTLSFDEAAGEAVVTATGLLNLSWKPNEGRRTHALTALLNDHAISAERTSTAQARFPVTIAYPEYTQRKIVMHLPKGGAGFGLTGLQTQSATIAGSIFTRQSRISGDRVEITESRRAIQPEIDAAALAEAKAALAKAQADPPGVAAPADYPTRATEITEAKKDNRLATLMAAYAKLTPADPEDTTPFSNRARFHEGIGEKKRALADLDRLIAIEATAENHLWRARLHGKEDAASAVADLRAARALNPTSAEPLEQLVALLSDKKDYATALTEIDAAIGSGINKVQLYRMRSILLREAGRTDESFAAIDLAVELAPGKPELLNERCWLKAISKRALDTALRDCTKAIDLMENPAAALDSRGVVYLQLGRFEDAISDFDAALKREPDLAPTMFVRGIARIRNGETEIGAKDVAAALAINPELAATYAEYGLKP